MDTGPKTTKEDLLKAMQALQAEQEKDKQALAKLQAKKKEKTTSKKKAPEPVPSIEPVTSLEGETEEDLLALQAKLLKEEEEDRKTKEAAIQKVIDIENETKKLQAEKISDEEYADFVDKNIVSEYRLKILANKVKDKEKLSDKEMAIFTGKTAEINKIIKEIKKGLSSTKTKTPKVPATPATVIPSIGNDPEKQKAEKEALEFLKTFDLGGIIPEKFKDLNETQKLKVVRDLERRIVDMVRADSETQYSEALKSKMKTSVGSNGKLMNALNKIGVGIQNLGIDAKAGLKKEAELRNIKNKVFKEFLNTEEGRKLIKNDFELLTKVTADKEIILDKKGNPNIRYISGEETKTWSNGERGVVANFEEIANKFQNMPYEWGQGNNRNKKRYEKAKKEYEEIRGEVLKIKEEKNKFKGGFTGKAMLEMKGIDSSVKLEQILNTHPEFQKELISITESSGFKDYLKTSARIANKFSGRNFANRGLMALGFGARWGTKALAGLTTTSTAVAGTMTFAAAPIIGGVIGYYRGKFQGKEKLQNRKVDVRYEKEKKTTTGKLAHEIATVAEQLIEATKNKNIEEITRLETSLRSLERQREQIIKSNRETGTTSDVTNLTKQLEKLIDDVNSATDEKAKNKALIMLATRIEHSKGKLDSGQINFGDAKSFLVNNYNFNDALNKAIVLKESSNIEVDEEVTKKIKYLLSLSSQELKTETDEAQKIFIEKQMNQGALMGAGFATAGYGIRWVGEQFGAWEWIGKHMPNMPKINAEGMQHFAEKVVEIKNNFVRGSGKWLEDRLAWFENIKINMPKMPWQKSDGVQGATEKTIVTPQDSAHTAIPEHKVATVQDSTKTITTDPKTTIPIEQPKVTPVPNQETLILNEKAIIGKGEGIEHALRRQIEGDTELAKTLGYKGDVTDKVALHAFSGNAAHLQALDKGYVDGKGGEIRINKPGEVAYQFKVDADGRVKILELEVKDGKLVGTQSLEEHATSTKYEGTEGEKTESYEYKHGNVVEKVEGTTSTTDTKIDPTNPSVDVTAPDQVDPNATLIDNTLKAPPQVDPTKSLETTIKAPAQVDPKTGLPQKIIGDNPSTSVLDKTTLPIEAGMTPEMTKLVQETYENHVSQLFKTEADLTKWNFIKTSRSADNLMSMSEDRVKDIFKPLVHYLHDLQRITGLEPISGNSTLGIKAESNEEYVKRALAWAAKNGKLGEIEIVEIPSDNNSLDHIITSQGIETKGTLGDKIFDTYSDNIDNIFYKEGTLHIYQSSDGTNPSIYNVVKKESAVDWLKTGSKNKIPPLSDFADFIDKIHKVTGLKPIKETEDVPAETTDMYIKRALNWAGLHGKLNEFQVEEAVKPSTPDDVYYDPDKFKK